MVRTIRTSGWLAGAACVLLTAPASAQLQPTSWTELVGFFICLSDPRWLGQDPASPEPLLQSVTATNYSLETDLTFGPPGPPFVTAHSEGTLSAYLYCAFQNRATAQGTVTFQLRIIEKAPPPVVVESVPMMISIHGSVVTAANSYGDAVASVAIMNGNTEVFRKLSEASTGGNPGPIPLDATKTVSMQPGVVLDGSISVLSVVALYTLGTGIGATASAGSDFEITSDVIPGTNYLYRNFFDIEYSPGYWALGNPTPVQTSTWGKIKSQYLQP
jgi:hypothetical protein